MLYAFRLYRTIKHSLKDIRVRNKANERADAERKDIKKKKKKVEETTITKNSD